MEHLQEFSLREVARQLRCPDGERGIQTAAAMEINNAGMIKAAIDALPRLENISLLEVGFGNAAHVDQMIAAHPSLRYTGADISALMVQTAREHIGKSTASAPPKFILTDGKSLPFPKQSFESVLTVNTLYFWEEPKEYASEIYRVLKSDGLLAISFAEASFMRTLPFTKFGFALYDEHSCVKLLTSVGFRHLQTIPHEETLRDNAGATIERQFLVMIFQRPDERES